MVAPVITVVSVRIKSSAVSVSSSPALGGRDSAPSRPSGLPVLKENVAAQADVASQTAVLNVTAARANFLMVILHCRGFDARRAALEDQFEIGCLTSEMQVA